MLDDAERARIGTMHAQVSAFAAQAGRRRARRAQHRRDARDRVRRQARDWAPLVYCWRGGKRSGALAHILNEIGWRAVQLDGGYRTYRRHVVAQLAVLPATFHYRGDLRPDRLGQEPAARRAGGARARRCSISKALAKHRGSLLGDLPDDPQPSQKWFESELLAALEALRSGAARVRRIGEPQDRHGAGARRAARRDARARCIRVDTPRRAARRAAEGRIRATFSPITPRCRRASRTSSELQGRKTLDRWADAAAAGDWDTLVGELLARHYDPMYTRSIARNFPHVVEAIVASPADADARAFRALAREIDDAVRVASPARTATA